MKIFDAHSHWATERGYPLRSKAALDKQEYSFGSRPTYVSESEMAAAFRAAGAKVILDLGFTKSSPLPELRDYNDYAIETQRAHADVIFGNWIQIDPRLGEKGAQELERCIASSPGFISAAISAAGMGFAASDSIYEPFYEVCRAAGRPVLILVGYTAAGAGQPGGGGIRLDLCHPRHVDEVAARYPDLDIIAGRPAWPWQDEMIAILLHKANVTCELHGWSPKHYSDSLKREISRRLRTKIMFGADYPLLTYQRLIDDWGKLGYDADVLDDVFFNNALRIFGGCGLTKD
jgi:predicted TIM-barrel fold metal-dependent hydrolase